MIMTQYDKLGNHHPGIAWAVDMGTPIAVFKVDGDKLLFKPLSNNWLTIDQLMNMARLFNKQKEAACK